MNDREPGAVWNAPSPLMLQWLTALGMVVAVGMLALGVLVLLKDRADTWQRAEQGSSNLLLALERDIGRNIAIYDLSLQGLAEALAEPGIAEAPSELRRSALFDRAASAEYLGSMLVLDKRGNVVEDSLSSRGHKTNLGDRDYFQVQKSRRDIGLYVSRPFRSRLRGGDPSIAISRRLSDSAGHFDGAVVGALRLAYFRNLFQQIDLGRHGAVTLLGLNGTVIAREPFRPGVIGLDLSHSANVRRFLTARSGHFVGKAAIDGVTRLYVFRRVGNLPLILNVGLSVQEIYAAWWREALVVGSVLVVLCGTTVALCLLFRREMLQRLRAETALREAADRLSRMAATDSLSGLANRRAFDTALAREWKRAIRGGYPLALLMLDVDCFKLFNDQYGHQEGDRVLQAVATSIEQNILRAGDLAARYGGEEFVVLLPQTDVDGATNIAECIRLAIRRLNIVHAGSAAGTVTASIGISAIWPNHGDAESALLEAADRQLYVAKRAGRNRSSAEQPAPARVAEPAD